MGIFQSALSLLASLMLAAALFLLWWKSKSPWLLIALVAEGVSMLLHAAFAVAPTALGAIPVVFALWGLCGLVMAGGLLAYAVTETTRDAR